MNKNSIGLATEALGLPAISPNALHMAERDGLITALRAFYTLRRHLDGYEYQVHGELAAAIFADKLCGVFSGGLPNAIAASPGEAIDTFIASLIKQCPTLIEELEKDAV